MMTNLYIYIDADGLMVTVAGNGRTWLPEFKSWTRQFAFHIALVF